MDPSTIAAHNGTTFAGVVGVDHYYTSQGMPCVDGEPQEFELQVS